MKRKLTLVGVCAVAAIAAYYALHTTANKNEVPGSTAEGTSLVTIKMPEIKGNAAIGERIFQAACTACHGPGGVGVDGAGPPLIHKIYEPSHHADESFQRAVTLGVRSHHWRFGDMPPVEGLTRADVAMVITYIREIQRANGIN